VSEQHAANEEDVVTRMEPPVTPLTKPFWDATREHRLLVQWCTAHDHGVFYPREMCPISLEPTLEWRDASGRGTVYSYTIEPKPMFPGMRAMAPYVVALIDLDKGVRMLSNVVGCAPEDVTVGMPVRLTWEALDDGRNLPQFEPLGG
jgi:uncharacterized OB-fold protein